jgi:hypothetical protein
MLQIFQRKRSQAGAKHVAGTRLSLNRRPLRRQIREIAIDRAFGHLQLPGQDR